MNNITRILLELRKISNSKGNDLIDELIQELLKQLDQISVTLKP